MLLEGVAIRLDGVAYRPEAVALQSEEGAIWSHGAAIRSEARAIRLEVGPLRPNAPACRRLVLAFPSHGQAFEAEGDAITFLLSSPMDEPAQSGERRPIPDAGVPARQTLTHFSLSGRRRLKSA
jgi:hypothetical protein